MRNRIGWIAGLVGLGACGLFEAEPEPQRDGKGCESDAGCKSGNCVGGICAFSSCGTCSPGFVCDDPSTLAEVLTLGLAKGVCSPTCSVCPHEENDRWACNTSSNRCSYDATPWVDVDGPTMIAAGDTVTVNATVHLDDDRELDQFTWALDGVEVGDELELTLTVATSGRHLLTGAAIDDEGRFGLGTLEIVACGLSGEPCAYDSDCCNPSETCTYDGYESRCEPPR